MAPLDEYLWLSAAAFAAGVVNAVAGGGTLLTFPALFSVISPVAANATSTLALLPGSLASAWGYREKLGEVKEHVLRLLPPSFIGGAIGSLLLIALPEKVFAGAIPWLLLTASTLLVIQKPISKWIGAHPHAKPTTTTVALVVFFQLLVGIYGGYFGAGIGILMLSSLAFMGIPDIHQMNGVKNLLAATMNGITVVILGLSGNINWKYGTVMALAATAGGYAGARIAQRVKQSWVRALVIVIGFGVAAYAFWNRR